ncbi:DUF3017 domain-containing protein [Nocardioides sp.]|nr:DUF3017 domain-containing protein [Nocardioides sp.]
MGRRSLGLPEPGWRRPDDPRHAAGQRGRDGREAGRARGWEGSALNDEGSDGDEAVAPRRHPSTIGGAFYIAVLAATAAGIVIAVVDDWRNGVRTISGALGFAALLRLLLPDRDAGMLAVRHRLLDVGILAALAVTLFVLAISIPEQPV